MTWDSAAWDEVEWDTFQNKGKHFEKDDEFVKVVETKVITTLKNLGYSVEQNSEGAHVIDKFYKIGPLLT